MTMRLYVVPGACSLSPHIVLRELGLAFELDKVDGKTKQTASGEDYRAVSPLGYVPALRLEDGQVLTEGVAIVQYLADQKPGAGLAPRPGTIDHYRLAEWLNFIATELHKGFGPLFSPNLPEDTRAATVARLETRLAHVDRALERGPYLLGDRFSVADVYLFVILTWLPYAKIDVARWPRLASFAVLIGSRPAVVEALRVEAAMRAT